MKMTTYVNFAGKCAEAFRFYEKHLGGTIGMMMTHGQAPDQSKVKPEWKDAVLHARIPSATLSCWARTSRTPSRCAARISSLGVDSDAEAERIFSALSEGGEVFMPMAGDVLRHAIRPAARSIRDQLDDSPRAADASRARSGIRRRLEPIA